MPHRLVLVVAALVWCIPYLEGHRAWGQRAAQATMTIRARVVEGTSVITERVLCFASLAADRPGRTRVAPDSKHAGRLVIRSSIEGQQFFVHLTPPEGFEEAGGALRTKLAVHGRAGENDPAQPLAPGAAVTLGKNGIYYLTMSGGLTSQQVPAGQYQSKATLVIAYDI